MFPDDENGAVLKRMAARGVDLTSPRVVDFEHCFSSIDSARAFQSAVLGEVLKAVLYEAERESGIRWEVQCRIRMVPTHANITSTESRLQEIARRFGGHADGWGSMSNPDGSPAE